MKITLACQLLIPLKEPIKEIDEYIEDHNPHNLESPLEADNVIDKFTTYMERFRKCQTELKVALGRTTEINILDVAKLEKHSGSISVSSKPGAKSCTAKKMHAKPKSVPKNAS